jgi:dCMP deaminase
MVERLNLHEWGLRIAEATALRGTCPRRRVGAVALSELGHVLATGYNGVPRDWLHCDVTPCGGTGFALGEGLDLCEAIHAEQNLVAQCADVSRIHTICVTTAPCVSCVKLLLATGARELVFRYHYQERALMMWTQSDRDWYHHVA